MEHTHDILKLLDRYWEGESSLEEERRLKRYFNSGEVAEELQRYAPMFRVFEQDKFVEWNNNSAIRPIEHQSNRRFRYYAAAASVALLLSVGFWYSKHSTRVETVANAPTQPVQETNPNAKDENLGMTKDSAPIPNLKINSKPLKRGKLPHTALVNQYAKAADPETQKAFEEVKAALALLSSKLSKGRGEASKGANHLDQIERIFKKKNNNIEG